MKRTLRQEERQELLLLAFLLAVVTNRWPLFFPSAAFGTALMHNR